MTLILDYKVLYDAWGSCLDTVSAVKMRWKGGVSHDFRNKIGEIVFDNGLFAL